MTEAGHLPAEWLDQDVAVIISGEKVVRVVGRLAGISELGTSLTIPLDEEGEGAETTVFYPWHRVESVRLAREDELPR